MDNKPIKELQLELSTHCNSNCTMCLRNKLKRKQGIMTTEMAFRIIDEAIEMGATFLKPQWFGETLLSYHWRQIVNYAKARDMKIMLVTNGSLVDEENRKFILQYVDKVFFSIDSHIKETYEKIRRGLKFDDVIENLVALYNEKKEMGSKIEIFVTAVEIEDNILEMEGFKDFFKDKCDRVVINKEVYCKVPDNIKRDIVCTHGVEKRLVVAWDGKCYLCCHDWLGYYNVGDLTKQSMKEIWYGDKRQAYLKNLKGLAICQQCMLSSGQ